MLLERLKHFTFTGLAWLSGIATCIALLFSWSCFFWCFSGFLAAASIQHLHRPRKEQDEVRSERKKCCLAVLTVLTAATAWINGAFAGLLLFIGGAIFAFGVLPCVEEEENVREDYLLLPEFCESDLEIKKAQEAINNLTNDN